MVVVDWSCMCKRNGEITDHLHLHCPVSQEPWNMACSLFWVHWVMSCSVVELLASWSNKLNRLRSKVLWRMIPQCLMWVIWREMNTRTFDGMKDQFMSFFIICLIGQMLRVFLLLFLYLICLIFVLSLLLSFFPCSSSTRPVCFFFPMYFLFYFQWSLLLINFFFTLKSFRV